jgi:AcrR family transcriptional regulator
VGRNPSATREDVLAVALTVLDTEGLGAVNARRLAEELNVSAMTPLRYFGGVDGLHQAMLRAAVPPPRSLDDPSSSWEDRVRVVMREIHDVLLEHPGAIELLMTQTWNEPVLDVWRERLYVALGDAGCPPKLAAEAGGTFVSLALGAIIVETFRSRRQGRTEINRMEALPLTEFPAMRAIARDYAHHHFGKSSFELGLDAMIGELRRRLGRPS